MPSLQAVVRSLCLHFPEAEEVISHGSPEYRVRDKAFARFTINHHGDGKLALLLNAAPETQAAQVASDPKRFFVPPYVGPRGWYGVDLAKGLAWKRVAELVRDAYVRVAPRILGDQAKPPPRVSKPDTVDLRKIDPFFFPKNQALLARLRKLCLALPETTEGESFGMPVFKAGKKTFCQFGCHDGKAGALFWVGSDGQVALTADPRFDIPAYMGHNGWIRLRLDKRFDPAEINSLALESYRHFALKRMLNALEGSP